MTAPAARNTDPWTSHAAAESAGPSAKVQRDQICATLAQHPEGLTGDALDVEHGWKAATACRRLIELVRDGRVVRTDRTHDTRSGRKALVHVLSRHYIPQPQDPRGDHS